jgi:hypothetical protein
MNALVYPLNGLLGPLGVSRRRSAPAFNPLSMPGLLAAYRSDAGVWADTGKTTPATDTVLAAVWADGSGNANDLVAIPGYPTSVPTFRTNIVNGLPVLRFTSSNVQYQLTTALSTVQTVYAAYSPIVDGSVGNMCLLGDASYYNYAPAQNTAGSAMFDTGNWSSNVGSGLAYLNGTAVSPPSSLVWTSGWQVLTFRQAGPTHISQLSRDRGYGGRSFYGDFAALYLGSSTVSDSFNTAMIAYLRGKYGI